MITPLQEKISKAIVNIFETGRVAGNYGAVVVAAGDRGHLSYGRSQTTLASGLLHRLIDRYCAAAGATFATELLPYLPRLEAIDLTLDHDLRLRSTLARAGDDPVMRRVQDDFFDDNFWRPALRFAASACKGQPLSTSLATTVVYDSVVHGSFKAIRDITNAGFSSPPDEKEWVRRYLATRRAWLAGHDNLLLRKTVYRMDELQKLVAADGWTLDLPFTLRGINLVAATFADAAAAVHGDPPERAAAHEAREIVLSPRSPFQTGTAVELLQHALVREGLLPAEAVDGIYGPLTVALVKLFQQRRGLKADGIVGPQTWLALDV